MTLLQMRYFQAVCIYDSVSIAADKLHVSQPTISTAIKALEEEFCIRLFDKVGKKLQLTEAGAVFLDLSNSILADAAEALNTMQRLSGENKQVRLGTDPTLAAIILPSLYKKYSDDYPKSSLYVEESEPQMLLEKIDRKEIDMLIMRDISLSQDKYYRLPLASWEYALCISQNHALANKENVSAEELEGLPLITFPLEVPPHSLPDEFFDAKGLRANIVYRSNQLSTIRRMIISNSMGHFTYRILAETWKNIHVCSLNPRNLQTISLYWRKDAYLSASGQGLIRCLQELCATDNFKTDL